MSPLLALFGNGAMSAVSPFCAQERTWATRDYSDLTQAVSTGPTHCDSGEVAEHQRHLPQLASSDRSETSQSTISPGVQKGSVPSHGNCSRTTNGHPSINENAIGALTIRTKVSKLQAFGRGAERHRPQQPTRQRAATARQTGVSSGPACPL